MDSQRQINKFLMRSKYKVKNTKRMKLSRNKIRLSQPQTTIKPNQRIKLNQPHLLINFLHQMRQNLLIIAQITQVLNVRKASSSTRENAQNVLKTLHGMVRNALRKLLFRMSKKLKLMQLKSRKAICSQLIKHILGNGIIISE